ncbi:MAG: hypothetical protein DHS20C09_06460 [marine bacterium B5-7]|nr:MAG: hypothetical protein DHS20C09_06460 [marine bacterium B5-7]
MTSPEVTNILLVEDNPGDARLVEIMLNQPGHSDFRLTCSKTMAEAVNEISKNGFDAALLDMSLPDGDGIENIARLKSRAPSLPIVVMTGRKDEEFAIDAVKAGAQDYLVKGQIDELQLSRALHYSIERKNLQEQITHLANHDQLTGLANRALFRMRLEHAISCAERRDESVAVLYIDLDRFKSINDSLGHAIGDKLLSEVSLRFLETVREIDTVARLGGDEFAILLENISQTYNVAVIAEKIIEKTSKVFTIDGNNLYVGCSIGIALYPDCGEDVDAIINNADAALYKAKENGRNQYQFFAEEMNQQSMEQLNIDSALKDAVSKNEFVLHYQPKFDRISGAISGSEVLLRWNHPEQGMVYPAMFIPSLEKSGLISEVGRWVLESACKQHVLWQEAGLAVGKIAVNLSGRQLAQSDFSNIVASIISDTGIRPEALELELTETLLIQDTESTMSVLNAFKSMGISIAIDDFGTGYNSFAYLKKFLIDTLKIDRSFIKHVTEQGSEAAITTAIIGLSKDLGINVVAEGVETLEQLEFLKDKKVDEIQGYYFSRPVTAEVLEDILFQQKYSKTSCKLNVG